VTPMKELENGMFARSLAGHDKGRLYLIIKTEDEYVYLTDGSLRPLSKPKRKNRRHIQPICRVMEGWDPARTGDTEIKRAIKLAKKEEENVESRRH